MTRADLETTPTSSAHTDDVVLVGLDFGSTTSSALFARARIARHPVSGKIELSNPTIIYRSDPRFTPFTNNAIDAQSLMSYLEQWILDSDVPVDELFAGGAIITGLAATRDNAHAIAKMVNARLGETLIATADDPRFESWLAFMGSCATLSRFHRTQSFVNLDIGGGTTNPAWGRNGLVLDTACYFIGARHFEVARGTYRLVRISQYGERLLHHLGIDVSVGDELPIAATDAILNYYVHSLEAMVQDDWDFFGNSIGQVHEQARALNREHAHCAILFSGGVGEIVYRLRSGTGETPETTQFGDLGIDLAQRIVASPLLSRDLDRFVPEQWGRATVYGLALHSTEVSGTTIFLSRDDLLPLRNVPIVARVTVDANHATLRNALHTAASYAKGACIQLSLPVTSDGRVTPAIGDVIKQFALQLGALWNGHPVSIRPPLLILTSGNIGKALGSYATRWGNLPIDLIVIDEISERNAHFVNVGTSRNNVFPVSFYGIH